MLNDLTKVSVIKWPKLDSVPGLLESPSHALFPWAGLSQANTQGCGRIRLEDAVPSLESLLIRKRSWSLLATFGRG